MDPAEIALQLFEFVGLFLMAGAVGTRGFALRPGLGSREDATLVSVVARRAATLGTVGALVSLLVFAVDLFATAAEKHVGVGSIFGGNQIAELSLLAASLVGFAIARGVPVAWWLAGLGVAGELVGRPLYAAISRGRWLGLVNPLHVLAASLWLGSLLVLTLAGLAWVLRDERTRSRRGAIVADMIHGFSPLALGCGLVVVASGVVTAWRHLHVWSSLWTTLYGEVLCAKLAFVAGVFGLGAWNWRRQRPRLGEEPAARAILRSSRMELGIAAIVLVLTAVLVSVPSPRPPRPPGAAAQTPRAQ